MAGQSVSRTQILTIVTVVDRRNDFPAETVMQIHATASSLGVALELVLVMNGCAPSVVQAARVQCETLPNLQIYVLQRPVDREVALFAGLDNAVGDWVATFDLDRDEPGLVGELFRAGLDSGAEVVLGVPQRGPRRRGLADALLARLFHRTFRLLHGYSLTDEAPTARLLSRAVLNQVLRHDAPMVALQTVTATGGHRKHTVPTTVRPGSHLLPISERIRSRWHVLIGINAVPLRLANLLCGFGALMALLYSVYVVLIYLFKSNVVPGWTTVSLMLSGMFLLLSLVLWLLSEYLILLLDAGARRPRYETTEEFKSNVQTRRQHLNVEAEL
jgi:hypothetical protein